MRAATWQGRRNVSVETVPDPRIEQPTDAIITVTSTNICGSDLHLYEVLGAFMDPGDVLGHEPMGVVEEVGSEVRGLSVGDRVVIPFQVCCGRCFMCEHGLQSQCETTQVREQGTGAALFGYSKLYGQAGGKAEAVELDVTDSAAVDAFFTAAFAQHGRALDCLVNNAGTELVEGSAAQAHRGPADRGARAVHAGARLRPQPGRHAHAHDGPVEPAR